MQWICGRCNYHIPFLFTEDSRVTCGIKKLGKHLNGWFWMRFLSSACTQDCIRRGEWLWHLGVNEVRFLFGKSDLDGNPCEAKRVVQCISFWDCDFLCIDIYIYRFIFIIRFLGTQTYLQSSRKPWWFGRPELGCLSKANSIQRRGRVVPAVDTLNGWSYWF